MREGSPTQKFLLSRFSQGSLTGARGCAKVTVTPAKVPLEKVPPVKVPPVKVREDSSNKVSPSKGSPQKFPQQKVSHETVPFLKNSGLGLMLV